MDGGRHSHYQYHSWVNIQCRNQYDAYLSKYEQ
ncbi:hypothetical protein OKW34_000820 [Paraburkholderia youngii]